MAKHDVQSPEELLRLAKIGAVSRRDVLKSALALGIAGPTLSVILAACGGDDDDSESSSNTNEGSGADAATATPIPTVEPPSTAVTSSSPTPESTSGGSSEGGKAGGELKLGLRRDFTILDPHVTSSVGDGIFMMAVFDRLVERTPDGKLYPGLATNWEASDDALTWTFQLRDDVTFHDGSPFNAEAAKFNFDRMVDPATKSEYAIFELGPYKETTIVDEYTIQLHLTRPYSALIPALTTYAMGMVSPDAVQKSGENFGQHPIGTGAFIFEEWTQKDHLTIVRNPDYNWASGREGHQGTAYLDTVTFQFIPEAGTRTAALKSSQIDAAGAVQAADWIDLSEDDFTKTKILLEGYPPAGLFINVVKAPTDDVNVRKAILHAINRDEVNTVVFDGTAEVADGIISTFSWAYDPDSTDLYPFDLDTAASLLDETGWMQDGDYRSKDGEELSIVFLVFTSLKQLAETVQAQLKEVGIKVDILAEDNPAQQQDAQEGKHNLVWTQWEGVDPADLHKIFGSENIGNGWNFSHYSDPEVDQWFIDGETETDTDKRKEIYNKIQEKVMGDAAYIPLYNVTGLWAFKMGLKDVNYIDELGASPLLYNIYWEE